MDLEFHQLELRHADLRIRDAGRRRRLLAALAEQGQQVPVVVVSEEARYVLIDGYLRVEALRQLGMDTVQATPWPLSEVDALVQHHHLSGASRSPFEQAWLLARLREQGLSMDELGRRLCRSKSWVSRRLALVSALSERVQGKVRRGTIPPNAAMKYLVPLSRGNKQQCEALVEALGDTRVSDRARSRPCTRAGVTPTRSGDGGCAPSRCCICAPCRPRPPKRRPPTTPARPWPRTWRL